MNKVLGFREEDAEITHCGKNVKAKWLVEMGKCFRATPQKEPVVSLAWLEKQCKENKNGISRFFIKDLLTAARKESGKR